MLFGPKEPVCDIPADPKYPGYRWRVNRQCHEITSKIVRFWPTPTTGGQAATADKSQDRSFGFK